MSLQFQTTDKLGHGFWYQRSPTALVILHWSQIKDNPLIHSSLTMVQTSGLTDEDKIILIVRDNVPVTGYIMRTFMNIATVTFACPSPSKDLAGDISIITEYFIDTIKDMNKPVALINEISFRIYFYVPQLAQRPSTLYDMTQSPNNIFQVPLPQGLVGYMCAINVDNSYVLRPAYAMATGSFSAQAPQVPQVPQVLQPTPFGGQAPQAPTQSVFSQVPYSQQAFGGQVQQAPQAPQVQQTPQVSQTQQPSPFGQLTQTQQPTPFGGQTQQAQASNPFASQTFAGQQQQPFGGQQQQAFGGVQGSRPFGGTQTPQPFQYSGQSGFGTWNSQTRK